MSKQRWTTQSDSNFVILGLKKLDSIYYLSILQMHEQKRHFIFSYDADCLNQLVSVCLFISSIFLLV